MNVNTSAISNDDNDDDDDNVNTLGPSDLSISLGVSPKHDLNQPEMVAATAKVLACCKARNKVSTSF